jgi:hypothetical protein
MVFFAKFYGVFFSLFKLSYHEITGTKKCGVFTEMLGKEKND